ncbi:hypothetical protein NCU05677 [Neurospora crassa OR74A]|uniref:Uncharacterized protein n=1 Tax=Neurospora crassa (strain ATCC 24698 / 74-OR23-1A / CBS 708.71 / DSM 1257 / FGSC 987) TaxID=367110 RepID=Q7SAY7_NEUCR|nr:hypothetical protein NCU05677 [Neurospora crassa OR74A]EAA33555.1 hypothetical protein NCU05677 [Neurospora crassa OR74A]|eukprot:XP_962791.1 hypothetical protein NCU05677 [Neurospora crassa OR74A]
MPKRPRTMGSAAEHAPDEANEDRRKRLRMALAVEEAVEKATGLMNEVTRKRFRAKLLEYYKQEAAKTRDKEQGQDKVSLESATLTRKEISETLKGLVVMLNTQKKQDQSETSPEPDGVSEDVDMTEETTGGGDSNMDQYEDEDDDDEDDDDDDDDDDGYSDRDKNENEEANIPEDECISSPWSVGDPSTPKDLFLEDSPQVDLMGPFLNEHNNRNRADRAVDPFLRDPIIQSLRSEADYENYHKRPRINFNHYGWRA